LIRPKEFDTMRFLPDSMHACLKQTFWFHA
jgi:hypothetical protein